MTMTQDVEGQLVCGDNVTVLRETVADDSVALTVTSPPYDDLRTYNGFSWDFPALAAELYRVTKPGGVVVWVVADATVDGSETGSSFRQALHFKDVCGFRLHDTMIWSKPSVGSPSMSGRYMNTFEFMFILSKGAPSVFHGLRDRVNQSHGNRKTGGITARTGQRIARSNPIERTRLFGLRYNIWQVPQQTVGFHPAPFPERLAADHITTWSNPGDLVLDPFSGSGTTALAAAKQGRSFLGIDISPEYVALASERLQREFQ